MYVSIIDNNKEWFIRFLWYLLVVCLYHHHTTTNSMLTALASNVNNITRGEHGGKASLNLKHSKSVLGKCTRCRLLSNSIYENLKNITSANRDKTADHNFLTTVAKLNAIKEQIGFDKIQNQLCWNIKAGRDDCRSLVENNIQLISDWWSRPDKEPNNLLSENSNVIFHLLCIETLRVCCPEDHYGPDCTPCTGYPNQVCSNKGKCAGAGTRLGNGHCVCKKGYQGSDCSQCDKTFYQNQTLFELNGTVQCLPCDNSCADSCFGPGSRGCHVCKQGFTWENEYGCFDIDECDPELPNPCPRNSFCINTEGSFQCYQCDHACDGCDGDGPDSCTKCAKDHVLKDGVCVNLNPQPLFQPYASPARYITYFGLCLVTCIIFRHNIYVSSAIGLAVALYIMASESSLDPERSQSFDEWLHQIFSF